MIFCIVLAIVLCLAVFAIFRRRNKQWVYGRPLLETDPEVVIVGSGTLGTALATVLARDGRKVTVIERAPVPPKRIVGEYLQPGGVKAMEELGLDSCFDDFEWTLGRGLSIHEANNGVTYLNYPDGFRGKAFLNSKFVMALRGLAKKENNCTYIEANVVRLIKEEGVVKGVVYKTKDQEEETELYAPLTVVADGAFSRLRKGVLNGHAQPQKHFATVLYQGPMPFEGEYLHTIVTKDSFMFYNPISKTDVRVMGIVDRDTCGNIKETLLDMASTVPEHAREACKRVIQKGTIESCLSQTLVATPSMEPGVLALGDAFSMCHAITACGMTVALNDVILWRDALRKIPDLRDYRAFLKAMRAFIWNRKKYSFTVNIYSVLNFGTFTAQDQLGRDVCEYSLRYMQRGGECHDAPARLLGIIDTRPSTLLWTVFRMRKYAMEMAMKEEPSTVRGLHKAATIFYNTLTGVVRLIWAEVKTAFVF